MITNNNHVESERPVVEEATTHYLNHHEGFSEVFNQIAPRPLKALQEIFMQTSYNSVLLEADKK
jgi:hypothetical protein